MSSTDAVPALRPSTVVLVHGAGSTPGVFAGWEDVLTVPLIAVDLQSGLDIRRARMKDYAGQVTAAANHMRGPVAMVGWSMGGLVALMAADALAAQGRAPVGLVLLESSPPGEVAGFCPDAPVTIGVFDPEEVYGRFPADQTARPESVRARAERKRGISIERLACPTLVISGSDFPDERGSRLAARYGTAHRTFPNLGHWELVRHPKVVATALEWLSPVTATGTRKQTD